MPSLLHQDNHVVGTSQGLLPGFQCSPPCTWALTCSDGNCHFCPFLEDHEHCLVCQGLEILFCLYGCAVFLWYQEVGLSARIRVSLTWKETFQIVPRCPSACSGWHCWTLQASRLGCGSSYKVTTDGPLPHTCGGTCSRRS